MSTIQGWSVGVQHPTWTTNAPGLVRYDKLGWLGKAELLLPAYAFSAVASVNQTYCLAGIGRGPSSMIYKIFEGEWV